MTIQLAALLAVIGVLLRALHYWVANLIPSWNSSGVLDQVSLMLVSVVDPLVWTYYFVTIWKNLPNRIAAVLAAMLGIVEICYTSYFQLDTLSWTSLDTLALVLGAMIPVLCWAVYLLADKKFVLWYLLLFNMSQVGLTLYQMVSTNSYLQEFWREQPWQLMVAPLIWLAFWVTQTLFVHAAQKA